MDDLKKSIGDKMERLEKEGTPVRSLATCARLFIENTYNSSVAVFGPSKAKQFFAERVNLVAISLETFKRSNQSFVDYCNLYPSSVFGASIAVVAIPTLLLFRWRTAVFASAGTALLSAGVIDVLTKDTTAVLQSDKKEDKKE